MFELEQVWDISHGMTEGEKRRAAAERARAIYDRLMQLPRPSNMSNNEWTRQAGVNTSFFTNVRNGSEPSIGNLRAVLEAVGVSLPEFFLPEAHGRLVKALNSQELKLALLDALPGLPRTPERRAEYIAEVVADVLALPSSVDGEMISDRNHHSGISERLHGATKQTGS